MSPSYALLSVLAGLVSAVSGSEGPSWERDYRLARDLGVRQQKPIVVVVGSGEGGWNKVAKDGKLSSNALNLLRDKYVCVYADTQTASGRQLLQAFGLAGSTGLVISDRSGLLQAFSHEGDLPADDLTRYLTKFSDPSHLVQTTESHAKPAPAPVYGNFPTASFQMNAQPFCPT